MEEEILILLEDVEDKMQKNNAFLKQQLTKIRAGRITSSILDDIKIDYYGNLTPISQTASINSMDARTLSINPWEKDLISEIEKILRDSDLGANPQNNGDSIVLTFPQITEERRKELAKQIRQKGEEAKIGVRNIRKDANDGLKKLQKKGTPEDLVKDNEQEVQKLTNTAIAQIGNIVEEKEKDIMTL